MQMTVKEMAVAFTHMFEYCMGWLRKGDPES